MEYKFNVNPLVHILHELNILVDSGIYIQLTRSEIITAIENKNVLECLQKKYPNIDLSLLLLNDGPYINFVPYFNTVLLTCIDTIDIPRKFGVCYNGITLLIALIINIIADGKNWTPNLDIAGL
jgi:hypothetical protein